MEASKQVLSISFSLSAVLLLVAAAPITRAADLEEIMRRGTETIHSDWNADPEYAYVERDEVRKGGKTTIKTYQVVLIDGSEYQLPIATDDQPFTPDQQRVELAKLKAEAERRRNESPAARRHRLAAYHKRRDEDGALLLDFPNAFDFALKGEEVMRGHPSYLLAGSPKKREGPLSMAARVLSGMSGTLWIDKEQFHVVRASCDVLSPVPVFGILAKVLPGTHIELEEAPASESVWLVSHLEMNLSIAKLWFKSSEFTDTTYSDYRLNSVAVKELLDKAGQQ